MANTGFIPDVIPVRLTFKGKEVRFQLDPKTPFDIVVRELKLQCGFKREQQFTLKWLDIDGDPVSVGIEREWQEALRLYTYNQDNELFLHIFEGPPPAPGQLCPGEDRSIYQRRGARRWKKIRRINGHAFAPKRFASAYCAICDDRIWGLGRQGYKCQACKMSIHKKCVHYIRHVCEGHPPQLKPNQAEGDHSGPNTPNAVPKIPKGKDEYSGHLPQDSNPVKESQISLDDFNVLKVIGRGSYAKVLMVELKQTKRVYAMKVIKKDLVLDEEDIDWVQTEKHVFEQASNHPFLVGLHSCFQTESRLFFVIECVNGGDLMFHMQRHRRLPEEHARFYSAEIALALNYLHERGIIYRDLKLDNVLLDCDGHVKLTDYGMCKEGLRPGDTTSTFCGTPNYIAPEILRGQDYGISVDWWALGVLLFEMLAGRSPFDVASGHEMPDQSTEDYLFQVILEKTIRIPRSLSVKAASVLKGFLNKTPGDRLGCHPQTGFSDIASHQFYKSIDWELLKLRQITPPYKPRIQNEKDPSNFDPQFTGEPLSFTPDDTNVLNTIDQTEFEGFEYVNPLLLTPAEDV
ncbi:protein kinase C iota type-like isoform X2 [Dysidea avara]|uniref:protein kinase C iota type-like isoform X2 n=1 Tax=Dysidea avara TaxID=196820 RepID=UPI00332C6F66